MSNTQMLAAVEEPLPRLLVPLLTYKKKGLGIKTVASLVASAGSDAGWGLGNRRWRSQPAHEASPSQPRCGVVFALISLNTIPLPR